MPNARARRATARPIRPRPTMPSTLPASSRPSSWVGVQPRQRPVRTSASPSKARRAAPSRHSMARSAVASVSTSGVLVTVMPRALGRRQVDVLEAGGEGGDRAHAGRQTLDQPGWPGVGRAGQDRHRAGTAFDQLVRAIDAIVGVEPGRIVAPQTLLDRCGQLAGDEDRRACWRSSRVLRLRRRGRFFLPDAGASCHHARQRGGIDLTAIANRPGLLALALLLRDRAASRPRAPRSSRTSPPIASALHAKRGASALLDVRAAS